MFSHIKFSAIASGLLVMVVASFVAFFFGLLTLLWAQAAENHLIAASASIMLLSFRLLSFLMAGYLTAQLAISQPLLHAAASGTLGSIFVAETGSNWWLGFLICLPTVIVGAWVQKKTRLKATGELMSFEIQACTENDWRDLKQVRLQSLLDAPTAFGLSYATVAAYSDADWQDRAANRTPPTYFIARVGEQVAGLVGGVKTAEEFNLIAMWVAPTHRGTGIGKALIERVLALAAAAGAAEVALFVSPLNISATSLYQSMGFRFTPHFKALDSFPEVTVQRMVATIQEPASK
ncbi:GNAT family N-acetyltransferase [Chitinibacter sp. SCUT-21]|uniref:GNAT family N-acetyltransferase n=1 Tax=Chitinibacter sp. SCUT-21 TaxID=2970891 RepID=UPI0035A5B594